MFCSFFFFFQAEDGIRDADVTGVQTCALPIYDCWESGGSFSDQASLVQQSMQTPQFKESPSIDELLGLSDTSDALSPIRSEERRVGKECRSRWSSDH